MKTILQRIFATLLAFSILCACLYGCQTNTPADLPDNDDQTTAAPDTTGPADTTDRIPVDSTIETDPPQPDTSEVLTEGPYVDLDPSGNPVTTDPSTQPPVTNPPITNPPVTNPPVTNPPVTNPPVTNPPVTNPPVTNPPVTNPPVTNPPVIPGTSYVPPKTEDTGGESPDLIQRPLALEPEEYYGYQFLAGEINGKAMQLAYKKIAAGVANMDSVIDLYDPNNMITISQFKTVLFCYRYDHPQHFWLGLTYEYTTERVVYVSSLSYQYTMSRAEAVAGQKKVNEITDSLLAGITTGMTELERELLIHDRLLEYIDYDVAGTSTNSYNVYGALTNRVATCEGYARALQYMLYQVGIQNAVVLGQAKGISHAWNLVRVDGDYYYCDATWDDPTVSGKGGYLTHAYFNITTEALAKADYVVYSTKTLYTVPLCTATKANYCVYYNVLAQPTLQSIAQTVGKLYNQGVRGYFSIKINTNQMLTKEDMLSILGGDAAKFKKYMQEVTGNYPAQANYSWLYTAGTNVFTFYFPKG